jgi:anti-sigma factor RsiW
MIDHPSGWTCDRSVLQFEYYLSSTLPRVEALAIAEHVEACAECAQRLALYRVRLARLPRG